MPGKKKPVVRQYPQFGGSERYVAQNTPVCSRLRWMRIDASVGTRAIERSGFYHIPLVRWIHNTLLCRGEEAMMHITTWDESWTAFASRKLKPKGRVTGDIFEAYKERIIALGLCIGSKGLASNEEFTRRRDEATDKLRELSGERNMSGSASRARTLYRDWFVEVWKQQDFRQQTGTGIGSHVGGVDAAAEGEGDQDFRKSTGRKDS